tara:strand:+ start:167 stop:739 length:573 start_codon:yes stop_codon:yes gene_type:complete
MYYNINNMPKNLKGGSKHKKFKNSNPGEITAKDMILKENNQDYAKVERLLGNCRVELLCNDGEKRLGIIRGSMRKKQWLNANNIVLYSIRDYEKDKVDIIHVYKDSIVKQLESKMNLNFSISSEEKQLDDIFMYNSDEEDTKINNNILIQPETESSDELDDDDIFMKNINKKKKKEQNDKNDLENMINEL